MWYLMFITDEGRIGISGSNGSLPHADRKAVERWAAGMPSTGSFALHYFACPACVVNLMRG